VSAQPRAQSCNNAAAPRANAGNAFSPDAFGRRYTRYYDQTTAICQSLVRTGKTHTLVYTHI